VLGRTRKIEVSILTIVRTQTYVIRSLKTTYGLFCESGLLCKVEYWCLEVHGGGGHIALT